MNKTAIKNFAIWARNKLIADVSYDARLIGITEEGIAKPLPQSFGDTQFFDIGTAEPYSISGEAVHQRDKLIEVIQQKEKDTDYKTVYQYVIEEVAYTWFNRLIAIRFMEVNDYLPSHIRVLSSESGKLEPDLVTTPFDAELPFTAEEEAQIFQLKQDNKLDEVFRILFLKQCNALNEILPALFEKTKNYTELLLSLSVTNQDGVVYHLIHDIPEDDFNIERGGQVEIIGWLYQYYNAEPKDEAFALLKKNVKITKERIPAATQLFTPDWIVRYMVENSLGRLWVEGHPDCGLKENWKYYLEEAQQEPEVQAKLSEIRKEYAALNPEDIKLIDPCMGSGHILVYAFDVLMQIYESAGYSQRDAAKSILEHNIYGLDIDDRAYQLAYFAVMMKARQYNRRILNGENTCHVYAIQESNSINRAHLKYFGAGMDDIEKNAAKTQLEGLLDTLTDAKEYGSILNVDACDWCLLHRFVEQSGEDEQMSMDSFGLEDTKEQLRVLIDIGQTMAQKYDVVVTNPPYMGTKGMSGKVSAYLKEQYPDSKADLFAVFIERALGFSDKNGYVSMITQRTWLFISVFEKLRAKILNESRSMNFLELGAGAFEDLAGEVVQSVVFMLNKVVIVDYIGKFIDLTTDDDKKSGILSAKQNTICMNAFQHIPGCSFAMKLSDNAMKAYLQNRYLSSVSTPRKGLISSDNNRFLRLWQEVDISRVQFGMRNILEQIDGKRWVPHNKGGSFRRWYGNQEYLINWENDGAEVKGYAGKLYGSYSRQIMNEKYYFIPSVSWSSISSQKIGLRFYQEGFTFDTAGPSLFIDDEKCRYYIGGFLSSCVAEYYIRATNPTINLLASDIANLPLIYPIQDVNNTIVRLVKNSVDDSRHDWDSFETSWNFQRHPLLCGYSTIEAAYAQWEAACNERFTQLKANEEELNRTFIDIYGLQDELTPEVDEKDVTVRKADLGRDIRSLISYAVGCMFGRYSLDVDGLAYAGGEWDDGKYSSFIPDKDNILPITDEEYFPDDIVGLFCAWLKKVYGEDTLEANLDFIAKALGNKGNSSREIIRSYFLKDFFKDHCKIYQNRPIYWLFDSGKQNGFKALVYLHRYTSDTIGNLRIDYLHKMQRVYESEINRMQDMMDHSENAREVAAASKRKDKLAKQLKECREYDEKISHLALSRIELDLDDGVKVNYEKVQTVDGVKYPVLAKI